jgi:hypothetical protein
VKLISSNSEEAAKHQTTLTRLYQQLNKVSIEDEEDESIRDDLNQSADKNID